MKKVGVFLVLLVLSLSVFSQSFKDVPVNHWAFEAVERLSNIGIIEGYPDGTFKGLENMNRYQLTVALSRTIDYVEQSMLGPLARDVANLQRTVNNLSVPQAGVSAEELKEVQNRLNTMATNLSSVQTSVTRLDNSVRELQNSYELLGYTTTKIDELERKINSITVPAVSESDINTLNTRVTNLESSLKSLNTNYQNLSQTVSNLQGNIANLESSSIDLQDNIIRANQEIERLSAATANLNSKLNSKVDLTDFAALENTTRDLSAAINNNSQSISDLTTGLEQVQTSVDQLSTEVQNVKTVAEEAGQGGGINFLDIIISVVISGAISFAIMNLSQ